MAYQATFKRYEIKYMLTRTQKEKILEAMKGHMQLDDYGRTIIRNIYFDTESFRLIRTSLTKPVYKEKLRIRSYHKAKPEDPVFIELKKKYDSIVYKRRLTLPENITFASFENGTPLPVDSQIGREIQYFRDYYTDLAPKVFLSYEREAFYCLDSGNPDFRITFDENILYRTTDLSLRSKVYGTKIISNDQTLMEIKTAGGIPLWMCDILRELKVYKTSFSKYGMAYQMMRQEGNELAALPSYEGNVQHRIRTSPKFYPLKVHGVTRGSRGAMQA